jgi:RNA polymerase sigma-70 factor (ECF subfamily)
MDVCDRDAVSRSVERPAAFAALFDRHYPAIWRYLCRRAGPTAADDLAGETFLRAFAGRARYDSAQVDARPWLYGIATNLLREDARREARQMRAYSRAAVSEVGAGGLEEADGRADASILAPRVVALLAELSAGDRDTLLLFALTDLDYEGVAVATGVPVGTVRSRLHRVRRRLRLELEFEPVSEGSAR